MLINNDVFLLKEIPKLHPESLEYIEFWREQKRRIIEGYWQCGKYMPGPLYFYANFGTILLNKTPNSTFKVKGKPELFDIFWEVAYYWLEARGFTGFESQPIIQDLNSFILSGEYSPEKEIALRKEISTREIVRKIDTNLGKPLYLSEAQDMMWLTNRGAGKSYWVADGVIAHEWLFDGAKEYTDYTIQNPATVSVLVGAGDGKYSKDLLEKTKLCIENLPGAIELNGRYYPSPLSKQYDGSWIQNKDIVARYKKKIGKNWKEEGSLSAIKHRSYKDNPYAGQGTRNTVMVKEEAGMFSGLIESQEADVYTMQDGNRKFGSCFYLGTGGDMSGSTIEAMKMFQNPLVYNLLAIEDIWENTGKIAYFTPATMGKRQYKDKNGITNVELAMQAELDKRAELASTKGSSDALDMYIQYNPLVPSEIFLTKKNNLFPVKELQDTYKNIMLHKSYEYDEKYVELYFDSKSPRGVNYNIRHQAKPIVDFPIDMDKIDKEGTLIVYEFPIEDESGNIPPELYIISHDPVKKDEEGSSLSSIHVLKTSKYFNKYGFDEVVATWVGRPEQGRDSTNELLEKLAMWYGLSNRMLYFENEVGNVKEYFEKKKKLNYLCHQPKTILTKKAYSSSGQVIYGYPMSNQHIKAESELYTRDWLKKERGVDENGKVIRNLHLIKDRLLLQQLMQYNSDGNFDAVMSFMGSIIGINERFNQHKIEAENENKKNKLDFLINNKKVFNNGSKSVRVRS